VSLNYFTSLFDFFLPRLCVSCKTKLATSEKFICSECSSKLEHPTQIRIQKEFSRKFRNDKIISEFASAFIFHNDSVIQELIHSLKYDKQFLVGKFLGQEITNNLKDKILEWNASLIIPVPLHALRKAERGFNQSEQIAKAIGKSFNIPLDTKSLKRSRFTKTQTKLTLAERKENMKKAFNLKANKKIKNQTIILIDDVITTGATITECARVLLENGANKIYALSVAIAD